MADDKSNGIQITPEAFIAVSILETLRTIDPKFYQVFDKTVESLSGDLLNFHSLPHDRQEELKSLFYSVQGLLDKVKISLRQSS